MFYVLHLPQVTAAATVVELYNILVKKIEDLHLPETIEAKPILDVSPIPIFTSMHLFDLLYFDIGTRNCASSR